MEVPVRMPQARTRRRHWKSPIQISSGRTPPLDDWQAGTRKDLKYLKSDPPYGLLHLKIKPKPRPLRSRAKQSGRRRKRTECRCQDRPKCISVEHHNAQKPAAGHHHKRKECCAVGRQHDGDDRCPCQHRFRVGRMDGEPLQKKSMFGADRSFARNRSASRRPLKRTECPIREEGEVKPSKHHNSGSNSAVSHDHDR